MERGGRLVVVMGAVFALSAWVSAEVASDTNEGLMEAAVHLIKVGRFDEAAAMLNKIVANKPSPEEALRLREQAGYDFLAPLIDHPKLGAPVRQLLQLAYQAIQAHRTDPRYIQQMVDLLITREAPRAVEQLRVCGAYAVPVLVKVLQDRRQVEKHQAIHALLTRMPADAAPAMVEALRCGDPAVQAVLADALGQMRSRLAVHELKRLAEQPHLSNPVRVQVVAALRAILGRKAWSARPAVEYYLELARAYHRGEPWAFPPGEAKTLPLWRWDQAQARLTAIEVPRKLYAALSAERTILRLVNYWPDYEPAYPTWFLTKLGKLWVAREHPDWGLDAAEVAGEVRRLGSLLGQRRLLAGCREALLNGDYRSAEGFLEGLELVVTARGVRVDPTLVHALRAPDRAVRYRAALVLLTADPREPFFGSELVVPVLAEAFAQTVQREVVLAATDLDLANRFRTALRRAGYVVSDFQSSRKALERISASPAVELVVLEAGLGHPTIDACLRQIRSDPRTRSIPVLLVAHSVGEEAGLKSTLAVRYRHVGVVSAAVSADHLRRLAEGMVRASRGRPLSVEKARLFARRAGEALCGIEADHPVFHLTAALLQARAALDDYSDTTAQMLACRILAKVGDAECQRVLLRTALSERAAPEVVRAALEALLSAVRRRGCAVADDIRRDLPALLRRADPVTKDLAARLLGMSDLPARDLVDMYRRAGVATVQQRSVTLSR